MPKVIKKILRLVTIKNITKCTRNEVAAAVGVDPSAVTRMFKRGCPRNKNGTYNLTSVIRFLREEASLKQAAAEMDEETKKWTREYRKEKSKIAKIQRLELEGKLLPRDAVAQNWAARVANVATSLESLADRLSVQLEMKSRDKIRRVIKKEVRHMRQSYAQNGQYTPSKRVLSILAPCLKKLDNRG